MAKSLFALDVGANLLDESTRLDRAWQSYVVHSRQDPGVRPSVLESWSRCAGTGLDAFSNGPVRVVSDDQVRDYVENDPVFADIKPVLPSINAAAFDSDHMLVCCDADGHIMHLVGEASIRRRADQMNFIVGSHWSEDRAGTNAIGTAIVTGAPVQLFGAEHYCHAVHPWTCSASPIHDPATNQVLAVINMTGLREAFHPHTLISVMAVTRLIEERLRSRLEADRYRLLEQYADHATRSPHVPIAVLDRGARIVKASPVLYRHHWIDGLGRLEGCPVGGLSAGMESSWEIEGPSGRWSFTRTTCLDGGRIIGAIVHVVKDASSSKAPFQQSGSSAAAGRNGDPEAFAALIGRSGVFRRALLVARSAGSALPVLIEGETGTGKELVARAIHAASDRATKPFVAVNCAALPRELATTELFGYEGGSFTGAIREGRIGKFEQANGGTLFLDEIGDMPLEVQALLLRVLEDGKVVHLGGQRAISVNVRVIAATNHRLLLATERGAFRRDLYYRLAVVKVQMPALRERLEDLELLFDHYCERAFRAAGRPVPNIDPAVMRILQGHPWSGNVRELRNVAEWLAMHSTGSVVRTDDLPSQFFGVSGSSDPAGIGQRVRPLKARELEAIQSVLAECSGNVADAARRLGINRSTIYRKLKKLPPAD